MKWTVVAVGRLKDAFYQQGSEEYLNRLIKYRPVKIIEVAKAVLRPGREADARKIEGERILKATGDSCIIALCERGEELATETLANRLERLEATPCDLAFVVGGASGLAVSIERQALWLLALSRLTLPHQLARLVLLEQLYRIETMRHGEPYHRRSI